jgi:hypothetical protein
MRETRLYYKGAHQQAYERFETVRLAAHEALLKRLVFLLGAERIVAPPITQLLDSRIYPEPAQIRAWCPQEALLWGEGGVWPPGRFFR